jgi:tetratricopeptide (TPR) repeat protein
VSTRGEELADRCSKLVNEGHEDDAVSAARAEVSSSDADTAGHAHNWLGWYFAFKKASFEVALEHCEKAVALLPEWGTALLNLAFAEDKLGRKDEAYAHYSACLLRSPYDRKFAETRVIALFLERVATSLGSRIVQLPTVSEFPVWSVVAPSGAHVLVLCKYVYTFGVSTGNGSPLPDDPVRAAKAVRGSVESENVSMIEMAYAMSLAIRERFAHETVINIPGTPDFVEVHLKSEACYVGFARGGSEKRKDLATVIEARLPDVERQLAEHRLLPAREARMKKVAGDLLAVLAKRVLAPDGGPFRLSGHYTIGWGSALLAHDVATLLLSDGRVTLRIGLRETEDDAIDVEAAADLIQERLTQLTADRLVEGARYRVLKPFAGKKQGDIISYDHYAPYDNHWLVHVFRAEDGKTFEVEANDAAILALEEYLAPA